METAVSQTLLHCHIPRQATRQNTSRLLEKTGCEAHRARSQLPIVWQGQSLAKRLCSTGGGQLNRPSHNQGQHPSPPHGNKLLLLNTFSSREGVPQESTGTASCTSQVPRQLPTRLQQDGKKSRKGWKRNRVNARAKERCAFRQPKASKFLVSCGGRRDQSRVLLPWWEKWRHDHVRFESFRRSDRIRSKQVRVFSSSLGAEQRSNFNISVNFDSQPGSLPVIRLSRTGVCL